MSNKEESIVRYKNQIVQRDPVFFFLLMSLAAALTVVGIAYPPYSTILALGITAAFFLLITRPDVVFALFFAAETLFSEDILLVTEKLAITIYRVPLPYVGINIFEAILLILLLYTLIHRKGCIVGTRLDFTLGLFAVACAISYLTCLWLYGDPARIFEPRRLLHFFAAYFLTVNLIQTKESLRMFLAIFFIAVILKGLEGVFLYTSGAGLQIKWRIRAIFTGWGDSLCFVTYLLFLGTFLLDRCPIAWKRWMILGTPFVVYSFLFSYKRAYYVAMVVGVSTLFLQLHKKARLRFIALSAACMVIMMGMITVMGQWNAIGMRFHSILNPTKESSANYRLLEWKNALISIQKHPVFGIGLGGVMKMEIFLSRTNLLGVHNTYLWVAVKMGAFGLFTYLFLHFAFLRRLLRQNRRLCDPFLRSVSKAIFCSFIAFCTAQLFAPMFSQMRTSAWLGIIFGLGMLLPELDRSDGEKSEDAASSEVIQ